MIYGLAVEKIGRSLEFRCSECLKFKAYDFLLVWKFDKYLKIYCETHPENFGEWRSETEMEEEKTSVARRTGLS